MDFMRDVDIEIDSAAKLKFEVTIEQNHKNAFGAFSKKGEYIGVSSV